MTQGNRNTGAAHNRFKHGLTGTPIYKVWTGMKRRCLNPDSGDYKNYGARGITIDPSWMSFDGFFTDMAPRPPGATLERVDNEKGYSKDNCIWADKTAQARNRRYVKLSLEAASNIRSDRQSGMTIKALSEKYGVSTSAAMRVVQGSAWK